MYSVKTFLVCCSVLALSQALTLEERDAAVWGSSPNAGDTSVRPFTVEYSDEAIEDLQYRLNHVREVPSPLKDSAFRYGFNTQYLSSWLSYWANEYDFKARAVFVNYFQHYKTNIQGLDIHHIKVPAESSDCKVLPLLIIYGFPGSFLEFFNAIPSLTSCVNGVSFDVVVASLPGHGFSDAPTETGFGAPEAATVMKNLMKRLGYEQFYLASGDNTQVGAMLATLYPDQVLGFHGNDVVSWSPLSWGLWAAGSFSPSLLTDASYRSKMYPLFDTFADVMTEIGYVHLLATKPDTIGVAMSESPAGLFAFMMQIAASLYYKDSAYRADGGIESMFVKDEVLDSLTVYWMTNSLTSSGRLFAETFNNKTFSDEILAQKTAVPSCFVTSKNSLITQSPDQLALKYTNILRTTYLDQYGYFLAYEAPEYFAESVRNATISIDAWRTARVAAGI